MDKIYLVEVSSGSYEDYVTEIVKGFENEIEATVYSEKYHKVVSKLSEFYADAYLVVRDKEYKTDEDCLNCFHHRIWSKYYGKFDEYNEVTVIEMPFVEHRRKSNLKILLD